MDEPEKVCLLSSEVLLIVEEDFRKRMINYHCGATGHVETEQIVSTVGNNIHIIESNHFSCVVSSKVCMCMMTVVFDTDPAHNPHIRWDVYFIQEW